MEKQEFKLLLHGIDTLQCAYYLSCKGQSGIDFGALAHKKEEIRQSKRKDPCPLHLGNSEFLLMSYGTRSGYSFVLNNEYFQIEFGQFMTPNFFVTFRSQALWRESAPFLHNRFLSWAASVGYVPFRPEAISRFDYCFDYHLPQVDFNEDSFKTRSKKDGKIRENKSPQTFYFSPATHQVG